MMLSPPGTLGGGNGAVRLVNDELKGSPEAKIFKGII
jgi:hypothetical protein